MLWQIARIAESAGIAMLTLHGRTRADGYKGDAEYETIAAVKAQARIPVVCQWRLLRLLKKPNYVLEVTGADAIMIGRAAQGRPWIFREIEHYLKTGTYLPAPLVSEVSALLDRHFARTLCVYYFEFMGVRTARKHIGWYVEDLVDGEAVRQQMNKLESCEEQLAAVKNVF